MTEPTKREELMPCPFCGAEAEKTTTSLPDTYSDHDIIACTQCGATNDNGDIQEWNRRVLVASAQSAEPQEAEAQRHEIRFIDATPDEGYIRRILEAYIDDSYYSDNTAGLPPENEVCKMMNKWREERNALLRAVLARLASKPSRSEEEMRELVYMPGPCDASCAHRWTSFEDMKEPCQSCQHLTHMIRNVQVNTHYAARAALAQGGARDEAQNV